MLSSNPAAAAHRCNNFRGRFPLQGIRHRGIPRLTPTLVNLHLSFPGMVYSSIFRAFPLRSIGCRQGMDYSGNTGWHGTTILCLRKGGQVVVAGDGQVTMGQTVVKSNARKLRRLANGSVLAGFAGATADAITLFERLEGKLEQYAGQLSRACVELAKDWRTDRYLRRLEAMMAVADKNVSLILSGTGDVLEPEDGIIGIGSGGGYALAAARALIGIDGIAAEEVARRAMAIAAGICIYTNDKLTLEKLEY
jgi:ATP-dependent HslUV protease, peptidase subunit HslV